MQKWYVAAHLLGKRCQQRLRTCNSVPCRYRHVSSYLSNIPGQHTWSSTFPAALLRPGEFFSSHTGSRATRHSSRVCRVGTSMGCVYRLLGVWEQPCFAFEEAAPWSRTVWSYDSKMLCLLNRDALVMWQDIYEYASELIELDGCVTEIVFGKSWHINHARMEPQRYWDTVRTVWMNSKEQHEERDNDLTQRVAGFRAYLQRKHSHSCPTCSRETTRQYSYEAGERKV